MKPRSIYLSAACMLIAGAIQGQLYTPNGLVQSNTGGTNIGVGLNNPDARLTVKASAPTGILRVIGDSKFAGTVFPAYMFRIQFDNTGTGLLPSGVQTIFNVDYTGTTQIGLYNAAINDKLAVSQTIGVYQNTSEFYRLRCQGSNHEVLWTSNNSRNFRFRNSNTGKIPLTLSPAGKVGINTSDFFGNHDLYVNGSTYIKGDSPEMHSLYIEGTTIAEEIFVKLKADWPDYAFTPMHQRLSLPELDSYIATHKRLPGMPAADKVAADGIEMGETVRLLTEKVEEITLYLIELKKENDTLKAEMEALKSGK